MSADTVSFPSRAPAPDLHRLQTKRYARIVPGTLPLSTGTLLQAPDH